jgi:hypothetical protein
MRLQDVLRFLLEEARNEFANALEGLRPEHLVATPVAGQNPIGWIVCHCMGNAQRFLLDPHGGPDAMGALPRGGEYAAYVSRPPGANNPPPDLSTAIADLDAVLAAGIARIAALGEEDLSRPGPHWSRPEAETAAENCLRVVNHANAHIREIWLLRWEQGAREHWPHQTLRKRPAAEGGGFFVPPRERGR